MTRIRLVLVAAVAAVALAAAGSASAAPPTLTATVGPGFTITLTKGGKKFTTLKAGTYRIVVRDRADSHNFHLKGPGVNKTTSVDAVATVTWTLKLKPGRYSFVCDPHASGMKGSFRVTA